MYEYYYNENGDLYCPHCDKVIPKKINPDGTINYRQNTMHYHYRTHEGPFTCRHCNKEYKSEFSLQEHIADQHQTENEPKETRTMYRCPVDGCGHESKTKRNRIAHFVRNHILHLVEDYEIFNPETKISTCSLCQKENKSTASFLYHIAGCLVQHNIHGHEKLRSIL